MRILLRTRSHSIVFGGFALFLSGWLLSQAALANPFPSTYLLPPNQWHQIVIPGGLPAGQDTLEDVFAEELDVGTYNSDWIVFRFDSNQHRYREVELDEVIEAGRGYWITQETSSDVVITLPEGTTDLVGENGYGGDAEFYVPTPIADTTPADIDIGWSMIGKPSLQSSVVADLRILTSDGGPCPRALPCTLPQSFEAELTDYRLYAHDPVNGGYDRLAGTDALPNWQGYWFGSDTSSGEPLGRQVLLPVPAQAVSFDDEFNSDTLSQWSRRHLVEGSAAQYTVLDIDQSEPGALTIVPTRTPGWFASGDAPLIFKLVSGNFSVETSVLADSTTSPGSPPNTTFNSAGLMARNPTGANGPENHIMVNVGTQNSSIVGSVGSESKNTANSSSQLDLIAGANSGRLILCR